MESSRRTQENPKTEEAFGSGISSDRHNGQRNDACTYTAIHSITTVQCKLAGAGRRHSERSLQRSARASYSSAVSVMDEP